MQSTGVDEPTPRGSQPTMSYAASPCASKYLTYEGPSRPGPPGLMNRRAPPALGRRPPGQRQGQGGAVGLGIVQRRRGSGHTSGHSRTAASPAPGYSDPSRTRAAGSVNPFGCTGGIDCTGRPAEGLLDGVRVGGSVVDTTLGVATDVLATGSGPGRSQAAGRPRPARPPRRAGPRTGGHLCRSDRADHAREPTGWDDHRAAARVRDRRDPHTLPAAAG